MLQLHHGKQFRGMTSPTAPVSLVTLVFIPPVLDIGDFSECWAGFVSTLKSKRRTFFFNFFLFCALMTFCHCSLSLFPICNMRAIHDDVHALCPRCFCRQHQRRSGSCPNSSGTTLQAVPSSRKSNAYPVLQSLPPSFDQEFFTPRPLPS